MSKIRHRIGVERISPAQVAKMDTHHRMMGFRVLPSRSEEKAQGMPAIFGRPGPKRRKHPLAPA